MLSLSKLLKPYREAGAVNSVLAPHRFIDEHCFLTKSGSVGLAISVNGIDGACLTDETLTGQVSRLRAAFGAFDESFRVYQYAVKSSGARLPSEKQYPCEQVRESVRKRNDAMESRGLYSVDLYIVLMYEAESLAKHTLPISTKKTLRVIARQLGRQVDQLRRKADAFVQETKDLLGARILPKAESFIFLRTLVTLNPELAQSVPLTHDSHVDYFLSSEPIGVWRDGVQIGERYLEALTLKEPPRYTKPDFFRELCQMRADFVLCTEWKPIPRSNAVSLVQTAESHFNRMQWLKSPWSMLAVVVNKFTGETDDRRDIVVDKAALSNVDELGKVSVALNDGDVLGQFSTIIIFHGENRAELREAVSGAVKFFGRFEAATFRETYNALNVYLSIIPGNAAFNMRLVWMLGSSYADSAVVFTRSRGEVRNRHLETEYLLAVETEDQTPYFLNLHYNDIFGVFTAGMTGAGKSVWWNTVIDHLQKVAPRTCILDIGGSYRQICQKYDGSYVHLNLASQTWRINPFVLEPTKDNLQFLATFVRLLLTNSGYMPNFEDERNIYDAVNEIYAKPADARRLGSLKVRKHLREALYNWVGGGQYGTVFDNALDTLNIAEFQVFDLQGLEDYRQLLEPLLFYIFRRQTAVVYDPALRGTFKLLFADEVWKFLANDVCRQQFITAGKTYRKHNGGIGLATQSAFDLKNAGVLEILSEICPTTVLLANPNADLRQYAEMFRLNPKEVSALQTLIPKRQFLLKKGEDPAIKLNLNLSDWELWQYRNDPFGNMRRDAAIAEHGFEEAFKVLAAQGGMK